MNFIISDYDNDKIKIKMLATDTYQYKIPNPKSRFFLKFYDIKPHASFSKLETKHKSQ